MATENIIHDPSNAQKSNIQKNPRKAIPPQLPSVSVIEKGIPRRSSRKNPSETDNDDGRGLSSLESPQRGGADLPGEGGAEEDKDRGREVQGGVDETAGGRREGEEEKGQWGVDVVVEDDGCSTQPSQTVSARLISLNWPVSASTDTSGS